MDDHVCGLPTLVVLHRRRGFVDVSEKRAGSAECACAGTVAEMVDHPADDSFEVGVSEHDGVVVVSVRGALDVVTSVHLTDAASPAAENANNGLIIDLTEVDMLSSSGLTALLRTVDLLPTGASAALIAPHPGVQRPITLSGLDRVITTVTDLDDAVEAVR